MSTVGADIEPTAETHGAKPFTNEPPVDFARPENRQAMQQALSLAGSWDDLDWDEMEAALDRIRHDSPPTPPITL